MRIKLSLLEEDDIFVILGKEFWKLLFLCFIIKNINFCFFYKNEIKKIYYVNLYSFLKTLGFIFLNIVKNKL